MRLIDADALKKVIYFETNHLGIDFHKSKLIGIAIDKAPTIEAEPIRHGKWIDCTSSDHYKCSKCGYKAPLWWDGEEYEEWLSQYCLHCGAKMEG